MRKLPLLFVFFSMLILGCNFSGNKPLVVSSIPVWKHVAEYLGGRDFAYYSILKGGESPHGYEIKPSDVVKLKKAKIIVVHGLGLDDWVLNGVGDKSKVFNVGELMAKKYPVVEKQGYHIWANPVMMEDVYFEIARELSKFYPSKEKYYEKRADDYAAMIEQLLQKVNTCLKGVKNRKVIAYHPIWEPLFETIGVKAVGYMTDNPEKEPGPDRIRKLIEKARDENVKVVVSEFGEGEAIARKIASEIGAKIVFLNPTPDEDYVVVLSQWCNKICEVLKEADK